MRRILLQNITFAYRELPQRYRHLRPLLCPSAVRRRRSTRGQGRGFATQRMRQPSYLPYACRQVARRNMAWRRAARRTGRRKGIGARAFACACTTAAYRTCRALRISPHHLVAGALHAARYRLRISHTLRCWRYRKQASMSIGGSRAAAKARHRTFLLTFLTHAPADGVARVCVGSSTASSWHASPRTVPAVA